MIQNALDLLKLGNFEKARESLEEALQNDLESAEILYTLKCISFWQERLRKVINSPLAAQSAAFERGEYLVAQWKLFMPFLDKIGRGSYDKSIYAVKHGVFSMALEAYQTLLKENDMSQESEIMRKVGLCVKFLGDYERSLRYLETARNMQSDSPAIIAELADCYALCGEVRSSKVLFREAFFVDAQKVETALLDSELICRLAEQVSALNYSAQETLEWIPVYGVLYGVFNVKRELRALELGKLKQTIYALENDIKEAGSEKSLLTPRLINHYFWLIDHYLLGTDDKSKINELLLKIKLLDANVYTRYTM